jgi:hypothetical protein
MPMEGVKKEEMEKILKTFGIHIKLAERALARIIKATNGASLDLQILGIKLKKLEGGKEDGETN